MNSKSSSLIFLSFTLLVQTSNVFAKNNSLEEIKALQVNLLKNKNAVDALLNTRAHVIPKEIDSLITGPGVGNYSRKGPLYSAVRQVSLQAVKNGGREDLFSGSGAMADLLKNYQMSEGDRASVSTNPSEKVYSLTVLNPQNLEVLKKTNASLKSILNEDDVMTRRLTNYIELSMKAKRYISFKEAELLSNQIAKMNSDMNSLEELQISLSTKDQAAVEVFKKNMNEFLNKKLVFVQINKMGFKTEIVSDYIAFASGISNFGEAKLNRDYTPAHVAQALKSAFVQMVVSRQSNTHWDDYVIQVRKDKPTTGLFGTDRDSYKVAASDANKLKFEVSDDRKILTVTGEKFKFSTAIGYSPVATFIASQKGKKIYDHVSQYADDGYGEGTAIVRALLTLTSGEETSMKNIYKDFGLDTFGTDVGVQELSVK